MRERSKGLTARQGTGPVTDGVWTADLPVSAALTDLYGRRAPILTKARAATAAYPPGFTNLPQDSFELLSAPPSPHGWRLQQAIGLGSIKATVQSIESARGRITSVRAGDRSLRGESV